MKKIIGCSLVAMLIAQSAFAAVPETYVDFDTRDVTISGTMEQATRNRMVSISVSDSDKAYYLDTIATSANGDYSLKFRMPESTATGYYKVLIGALGSSAEEEFEFYFAKKEDIENTLSKINNAASVTEVRATVDSNIAVLNISEEWYDTIDSSGKNAIAQKLFDSKPYATIGDAIKVAYAELAVQAFRCAKNGDAIEKALTKFADIYGIDDKTAECYDLYSESLYAAQARIIMVDYNPQNAAEVIKAFNESTLLAEINNAKDLLGIKNLITEFRNVIPFSLDTYDKSNEEKTLAYLYGHTPIKSMAELNKDIEDAYKKQKESTTIVGGGSSGSSGGGGGRGSSGGSVSPSSVNLPPTPTAKPEIAEKTVPFKDMASAEWAKEAVEYLASKGIVNGMDDERFAPNDTVTREQFVVMIVNAFGIKNDKAACSFNDMGKGHWAYEYVASACEKSVINGISDTEFGTGKKITRQDMAVILYRAAKLAGYDFGTASSSNFIDNDKISDYARESVAAMSAKGIINGYPDGSFGPNGYATRAEAAQVIYSVIK